MGIGSSRSSGQPSMVLACQLQRSPSRRYMLHRGRSTPQVQSDRDGEARVSSRRERRRPPAGGRPRCPTKCSTPRHRPRRDPVRALASRSELVERTGLGAAIVAQRVGELIDRGLIVEGDGRAEHRRPSAATARIPRGRRTPARRRPRRDEHRRGRHRPSTAGSWPSRRARRHRRRAGASWAESTTCSTSCDRDPRSPCPAPVGRRDRRPGPGRVRHGPAHLATDHARLGRLSDPRALRRAVRRAGLGRQRREPPRPR